ncbi:hypothetical protein A9Q88_12970 [Gammaproteobacteria bacterium 50_400_T64]|nr:hypothetical protein A9Q88_12970 [Gammaproteobacteria bacterium 50_400_T64]
MTDMIVLNSIPDDVIKKVVARLHPYRNSLHELYRWPLRGALKTEIINARFNTWTPDWVRSLRGQEHKSIYKQSIALRDYLYEELNGEMSYERRTKHAAWIVGDWGGISIKKDGKSETDLFDIITSVEEDGFQFKRVASWSKYFAFKSPQEYAIYDERVIYSLNWLLFTADSGCNYYLPSPGGRNTVMNLFDYSLLIFIRHGDLGYKYLTDALKQDVELRKNSRSKSSLLKKLKNKIYVKNNKSYSAYLEIMNAVADALYDKDDSKRLLKTEMILFSIADKDIPLEVLSEYKNIGV